MVYLQYPRTVYASTKKSTGNTKETKELDKKKAAEVAKDSTGNSDSTTTEYKTLSSAIGVATKVNLQSIVDHLNTSTPYRQLQNLVVNSMMSEPEMPEHASAILQTIISAVALTREHIGSLPDTAQREEFARELEHTINNSALMASAISNTIIGFFKAKIEREIPIEEITAKLAQDKDMYKEVTTYKVIQFIINKRVIEDYLRRNGISEPLTQDNYEKYLNKYVEHIKKTIASKDGKLTQDDLAELTAAITTLESLHSEPITKSIVDALKAIGIGHCTQLINITTDTETNITMQTFLMLYKISQSTKELSTREMIITCTLHMTQEKLKDKVQAQAHKGLMVM